MSDRADGRKVITQPDELGQLDRLMMRGQHAVALVTAFGEDVSLW